MENKVKNVLSGIGFYGTLAVCLLVVGVCGWVLLGDREDPRPQQAVTPQVPVSQPVEMPEVRLPTVETLEPAPVPVPPKETKELPEVEVDHTPVAAEAPRLVVAPLRGDVLTAFPWRSWYTVLLWEIGVPTTAWTSPPSREPRYWRPPQGRCCR